MAKLRVITTQNAIKADNVTGPSATKQRMQHLTVLRFIFAANHLWMEN